MNTDTLSNKLQTLKKTFGDFAEMPDSHPRFDDFLRRAIIVLPAGGESSRFKQVSGAEAVQKSAFRLPSGETMIERTIALYRGLGFKRFVILLYHYGDSIEKLLQTGEQFGVTIEYSYDPGHPVGRGGALRVAYESGKIPDDAPIIVHNPDDQFVGDAEAIFRRSIAGHLMYEDRGGKATALVAEGAEYAYSGLLVEGGIVVNAEMYPFIPIPTHTGVTIFSSGLGPLFTELFNLAEKSDFEPVIFPRLIQTHALCAAPVPRGSWIPVNDEKGLKRLLKEMS